MDCHRARAATLTNERLHQGNNAIYNPRPTFLEVPLPLPLRRPAVVAPRTAKRRAERGESPLLAPDEG